MPATSSSSAWHRGSEARSFPGTVGGRIAWRLIDTHLEKSRLVWVDGGLFEDQESEEMEAFIWAGFGQDLA